MRLTIDAIRAAQLVMLPNQEQIFTFTDYDKRVWKKAFDWYNDYMNLPKVDMNSRPAYSKVFNALKTAKDFVKREEII